MILLRQVWLLLGNQPSYWRDGGRFNKLFIYIAPDAGCDNYKTTMVVCHNEDIKLDV